ncbi:MAG TPA: DUF4412 domain-containing protein [Thermoanaerobaculia bacterium]|nr:DUF4412 domain-containing protein [Thermoanaerobaculia bacterium]
MKNLSRSVTLALLLALAAMPAFAGVHYKSVTRNQDANGKSLGDMAVEGWVTGSNARVEVTASDNPILKKGTFLVTKDGGKTLYLVDPKEKTYGEWDVQAMLGAAGAMLNSMGPLVKMEFSDPKVEKLAEDAGPTIAGLPTRHFKYRTSYTMKMKVMGMGQESAVVSEQDLWVTDKINDAALGVWLRNTPPKTGNEQLDKLIDSEIGKVTGYPMKMVTVSTSTSKKGKATVTRSTMEVTELDTNANVTASFDVPAGYEEVPMMMPMAQPGSRQ